MRRVLVPLDGTEFAASIIPDARRLAGPGGELILICDTTSTRYGKMAEQHAERSVDEEAEAYLNAQAAALRAEGVKVSVHRLTQYDVAWIIDIVARSLRVDMIACATHGRGPLGRLVRGSVAWKAVADSPVPILLHHPDEHAEQVEPSARRILVPLDGSHFAEVALPLARDLAAEWHASIWLVQVVCHFQIPDTPYRRSTMLPDAVREGLGAARAYLKRIAQDLPGEVHGDALVGPPVAGALLGAVQEWQISDVVMASHGRTGLSRVITGSVADTLIQHLHCPIIIVPAQTAEAAAAAAVPVGRGAIWRE